MDRRDERSRCRPRGSSTSTCQRRDHEDGQHDDLPGACTDAKSQSGQERSYHRDLCHPPRREPELLVRIAQAHQHHPERRVVQIPLPVERGSMMPGPGRTPTNMSPRGTLSPSRLSSNSFAARAMDTNIAEGHAFGNHPFWMRGARAMRTRARRGPKPVTARGARGFEPGGDGIHRLVSSRSSDSTRSSRAAICSSC